MSPPRVVEKVMSTSNIEGLILRHQAKEVEHAGLCGSRMHLLEWVLCPEFHTVCPPHMQGLLQGAELAPIDDVALELHLDDMSSASLATVLAVSRMLYTRA